MAGDIAATFNQNTLKFDWLLTRDGDIADSDYAGISDLQTAVEISLFTDRVAPPDWVFPLPNTDRRGWWGDAYTTRPIGSLLWLLPQQKGAPNLLQIARTYAQDALQWLLDDGIAATVVVTTSWLFPNTQRAIQIDVQITEPVRTVTSRFQYSWTWDQISKPVGAGT